MTNLTKQTLQNKYFLRECIGEGGTSDIYRAWDKVRASEVAVKVLHSKLSGDPRFQEMFNKEAEFMRDLRHPNIVRIYDFGQDGKRQEKIMFIVMEYVKGVDLRRLIIKREQKPLDLLEISQVLTAVCKALNFAHQNKVWHGDIKSANILISEDENNHIREKDTFLADFGVSRWAFEQKGGGTPAYMAPELFKRGSVTDKSDIYALGVTLYEMLSGGRLPFKGDANNPGGTPRERIAWEKDNKTPPSLLEFNPSLPLAVASVVEKALKKNPTQRQASIFDVLTDFEHARNSNNTPATFDDQNTVAVPYPQPSPPVELEEDSYYIDNPHLFGVVGELAGQSIPISHQGITIGRSQNNQLRLMDRSVSRTHAAIMWSRQAYYICDKQSSVGTYLNGRRLTQDQWWIMRDHDRIGIGRSQVFEFRIKG